MSKSLWMIFLLPVLILLAGSCRFNPEVSSTGEKFLQGVWAEDSVQYQEQRLQYTLHQFTFTCDSFYAVFKTKASASHYADSCFNEGTWTEYAKGLYALRNDTLYLSGVYTRGDLRPKLSGCFHTGEYRTAMIVKNPDREQLLIENQHVTMNLILKKEIICKSK